MKISGTKLNMLLAERTMGVRELCQKAKISSITVANLAKKEVQPKTVGKIAKALKVPVSDLLEDTEV